LSVPDAQLFSANGDNEKRPILKTGID